MPYTGIADRTLPPAVRKLPKKLREIWVAVFNDTHQRHPDDESAAFRNAWAAVRRAQEAKEMTTGTIDVQATLAWLKGPQEGQAPTAGLRLQGVGPGEKAAGTTKTDGGQSYSADAYLYVPDPEKPSEWKLRVEASPGKVTVAQLGRAAAALSGKGFMGQTVQMPDADKRACAKKLIGLYRDQKVDDADIPEYLWSIAGMTKPKAKEIGETEETEKAGARHSSDDLKLLHEIKTHAGEIQKRAVDLGAIDEAKSVDLSDWRNEVINEFYDRFPQLAGPAVFCYMANVFDDHLIVQFHPNDNLAVSSFDNGNPQGVVGSEPKFFKVPYTCERVAVPGDPNGTENIENIQFAQMADWVQVVPTYVAFKAWKQADGRVRWLKVTSGGFEDRDGEVVSTAFLESAVEFGDQTKERGPLVLWHVPSARVGECDFQAVVGEPGFLLESGLFDLGQDGEKAAQYYLDHPGSEMSIRFLYANKTPDGVYEAPGIILERSLLPPGRAAFAWSGLSFEEMKDMGKQLPQEKVAFLEEVLGPDRAKAIVDGLDEGAKGLQAAGVRFKELNATPDGEPEPKTPVAETEKQPGPTGPLEVVFGDEVLTAIAEKAALVFQEKLAEQFKQMGDGLSDLRAVVAKLSADVEEVKRTDEEKVAEKVASLPRATLRTQALVRPTQAARQDALKEQSPEGENLLALGKKALYGS